MRTERRLYLFQEIILIATVILDKTNLLKIKKKEWRKAIQFEQMKFQTEKE